MTTPFRMTVIHSVPDYDRYHALLRDELTPDHPGLVGRKVFRSIDDPDEVMIELEFESEDAAKALLPSLDLRDLLDRSGIEVYPPVFIGREVDELRYDAP